MPDKFDDIIARIDRPSPSFADALPGIVLLFKLHETKIKNAHDLIDLLKGRLAPLLGDDPEALALIFDTMNRRLDEFDQRIEKTNVDFMKKLDGLADHLDESRHRLHGSINHTDDRATEAMKGVKRAHGRIDFLEDRMTGMEARVPKTAPVEVNVTADTESLTAYVHRLETLINDIEKGLSNRLDVHRTDINRLEQRISDCEMAVGTDKLEPAPQRDTSWHPYDVLVEGVIGDHPKGDERVVVMVRGIDEIVGPAPATYRNWDEQGDSTIVAWRYAKDGE